LEVGGIIYGDGSGITGVIGADVASNSLDFDEFVDEMTLDANLSVASAGYNTTWNGNSYFMQGNVGIGTTAPDGLLHIHKASGGTITPNAGADELIVENSRDTGISILTRGQIRYYGHGHATKANHMIFSTSATEQMVIDGSGNVGIGTTTPATGYKLDVAGFVISDETVDQESYPSIYGKQTASTLQDGSSGNTGTDEAFDNTWEAIKFTADGNHNMRSFGVRLKVSAALTNPTSLIYGYLYTDSAGAPGTKLTGGTYVRYGSLTTSYAEYQFRISQTLTDTTNYWLVLKQSAAPAGGTISIDRGTTGTGLHAYSANGLDWTTENSKQGWHKIYGRTYVGVLGSSTNSYGVQGSSTNSYGVYGLSTNSYGVYGLSTNSYGVQGSSTNSYGVYGLSTNSYGVQGFSANSIGVRGISTNNRTGYFYRNSDTATTANFEIISDHTGDTNTILRIQGDGTGDLVNIFDGGTEV